MSTVNLFLLGGVGVAVILLVGWIVTQPDPTEPRRPRGYRPAHRGGPVAWKPDVEAPLPPARALEEQLVSFPVGHPEQARAVITAEQIQRDYQVVKHPTTPWLDHLALKAERTEEMPVAAEPVVHRGADAMWSPTRELSLIPERPIDAQATLEQDIEAEVRAEIARIFEPIEHALARIGHLEQDTCEISFAQLRAAIEAEKAASR